MNLTLLLTGNELMTGDTLDSNSAMIAQLCLEQGIPIDYKVTIADDFALLVSEIARLSNTAQVLLINGGLGPTCDDLTAAALARVLAVELEEHPQALAHLNAWCAQRHYRLSEANRKQALLPRGITIVPNAAGSAVGFKVQLKHCLIICTPGVPSELKVMLEQQIVPMLAAMVPPERHPARVRLRVFGYGESNLQQQIHDTYPDWPAELELGFRASMPLLELKLQVSQTAHQPLLAEWKNKLSALLGDHLVTEDNRPFARVVIDLLLNQNKKITCAESCTGGLIASMITEISGASAVFEAGFVTYADRLKSAVLGVSEVDLRQFGAVSETVVRQMLAGAMKLSGADLGVAVSGIAGPSGGTEQKPVGTVWLAWGSLQQMHAREFYFPGSRGFFQKIVAALALDLLRRELLGSTQPPVYFEERKPQRLP